MTNDDNNKENMNKEQLLGMISTFKKLHSLIRPSTHNSLTEVKEHEYLLWADLIKKINQLDDTIYNTFNFSTTEKRFIADVIKTAKDFGVVRSMMVMAHHRSPISKTCN